MDMKDDMYFRYSMRSNLKGTVSQNLTLGYMGVVDLESEFKKNDNRIR